MKINRFLLVALLTIGALVATLTAPAGAILRGEDVDNPPPWIVRLVIDRPAAGGQTTSTTCTGTLIDSEFVLTAGHCVRGRDASEVRLFREGDDELAVADDGIIIHPLVRNQRLDTRDLALVLSLIHI